jgi:hypothetical protein
MTRSEILPSFLSSSTDTVISTQGDNNISLYNISIGTDDKMISFGVQWNTLERGIKTLIHSHKRETLLIEAIRNFLRKVNFTELNESLNEEEITEEQFEHEINQHSDKYAITLRSNISKDDVIQIIELVDKIGFDIRDLSSSEVSEMFSVKESDLMKNIKSLKF